MFIIYICIIFVSSFFIISGYFNEISLYEKLERDKLKGIAASIALNIDGNKLETLMSSYPWKDDITTAKQDSNYYEIFQLLENYNDNN